MGGPVPILQMRTLRQSAVKWYIHSSTASKWMRQDLNSGLPGSRPSTLSSVLPSCQVSIDNDTDLSVCLSTIHVYLSLSSYLSYSLMQTELGVRSSPPKSSPQAAWQLLCKVYLYGGASILEKLSTLFSITWAAWINNWTPSWVSWLLGQSIINKHWLSACYMLCTVLSAEGYHLIWRQHANKSTKC